MATSKVAWLGLFTVLVVIGGCQQNEQGKYRLLYGSEFGIGVSFGMSPYQVHEVLGLPTTTKELQGGASVEDFYYPAGVGNLPDSAPYLSLTYHYKKLVRVGSKYYPEYSPPDFPPFLAGPLPGVKLGARRSAFVDALGPVEKEGTGETWRFHGARGEFITVKAWFSDVAADGDTQCSTISVTHTTKVENPRGEAFKEKK